MNVPEIGAVPDDVLVLSDVAEGGAAVAMLRTTRHLQAYSASLDHWHFSHQPAGSHVGSRSLDNRRKRPPVERLLKNLSREAARRLMRSRHNALLHEALAGRHTSIVNLHNIHDAGIDHDTLLAEAAGIPLVWTMHDCWSFAEYGFRFHNSHRGGTETAAAEKDAAAARARRARFFAERPDTVLVAPSHWLAREARAAVPAGVRVEHIPYGLPLDVFHPIDKAQAKAILGLDPKRTWMGFASTWANSRKGTDVLSDALKSLNTKQLGCVAWGGPIGSDWPAHVPLLHFGSIHHDRLSALMYSACDFFVCPSRADNLPNTCLESLACGTPVLGSDAGGVPDMARPGETGWVFSGDDPRNCARAIEEALDARLDWPRLQDNCRAVAEEEYAAPISAGRYAALFRELSND